MTEPGHHPIGQAAVPVSTPVVQGSLPGLAEAVSERTVHPGERSDRRVLLCDSSPPRRQRAERAIAAADGRRCDSGPNGLSPGTPLPAHQILLLGIDDPSAVSEAFLKLMAQRKLSGATVIVYGDGEERWPIRCKARFLLAGVLRLLDSAQAGFAEELQRVLAEAFSTAARIRGEALELQTLMREHGVVGLSPAITEAFRLAVRFSQLSDLPVLITGESGTGKELLAKAIARMDPKRKAGPLLAINCAAVPPHLFESEFFGHRRGAFTGADRPRKGWIRAAEGGVLFLDEIGELNLDLQAKLLRVLQEGRVLAVGEEQAVDVNVRFIAATNRDLEALVAERRFRADLFHRLRVLLVRTPALRERSLDLPMLVEHFLSKCCGLRSQGPAGVSRDFLEALGQLDLPGNVRQLENLVRQAVLNHSSRDLLDLADLPADALSQLSREVAPREANAPPVRSAHEAELPRTSPGLNELVRQVLDGQGWGLSDAVNECERIIFRAALQRTDGNQSRTARLLGITARSVYNKVRKHQLHR